MVRTHKIKERSTNYVHSDLLKSRTSRSPVGVSKYIMQSIRTRTPVSRVLLARDSNSARSLWLRRGCCRPRSSSGAVVVVPARPSSSSPSCSSCVCHQRPDDKAAIKRAASAVVRLRHLSSSSSSPAAAVAVPAEQQQESSPSPPEQQQQQSLLPAKLIDFATQARIEGEESHVATVTLHPGEALRAEAGAMLYMTEGVVS